MASAIDSVIVSALAASAPVRSAQMRGVPRGPDNLFTRIIRNPRPAGLGPKERACAEMLCSVIRMAPRIREEVMRWFAAQAGNQLAEGWEQLEFEIETEQPMWGKRDDLRVVGRHPGAAIPEILWTIEIKVGADFHDSSPVQNPDDDEPEAAPAMVHQVRNYDRWLDEQPGADRRGFVLGLGAMNIAEEFKLKREWTSLSWRALALVLHPVLEDSSFPAAGRSIAAHMVGFIQDHLWTDIMATDPQLDFEDLALLHALALRGPTTEARIYALVELLVPIFDASPLSTGDAKVQKSSIYTGHRRRLCFASIVEPEPYFYAGVVASETPIARLWLESNPRSKPREQAHKVLDLYLPKLTARNAAWCQSALEDRNWWDLKIDIDLLQILAAADPAEAFVAFFKRALRDLEETGAGQAYTECWKL